MPRPQHWPRHVGHMVAARYAAPVLHVPCSPGYSLSLESSPGRRRLGYQYLARLSVNTYTKTRRGSARVTVSSPVRLFPLVCLHAGCHVCPDNFATKCRQLLCVHLTAHYSSHSSSDCGCMTSGMAGPTAGCGIHGVPKLPPAPYGRSGAPLSTSHQQASLPPPYFSILTCICLQLMPLTALPNPRSCAVHFAIP